MIEAQPFKELALLGPVEPILGIGVNDGCRVEVGAHGEARKDPNGLIGAR